MNACRRIRLWCTSGLANGPAPFTVCQIATIDVLSTTQAVTPGPPVTAAPITSGNMTYSIGCAVMPRTCPNTTCAVMQRRRDPCRRSNQPRSCDQVRFRPSEWRERRRPPQGITEPPVEPEHREPAPGLNARKCTERSPPNVALMAVHATRGDEHEGEDVTRSAESWVRTGARSEPPDGGDGFETFPVAMMNAVQAVRGCPRLAMSAPTQIAGATGDRQSARGGEGDAGRRPDGRDLLGHERQAKSNRRGENIGNGDGRVHGDRARRRERLPHVGL